MTCPAQRSTAGSPRFRSRLTLWSCLALASGPAALVAENPAPAPQSPDNSITIRAFDIIGNQTIAQDRIISLLQPVTGPSVGVDELRQALLRVREFYREQGYPDASIQLPRQRVTDGVLILRIHEGTGTRREPAASHAPATSSHPAPPPTSPPPAEPAFEVRHYEVTGNTTLPTATIDRAFASATGTNVTFSRIQQALGALQLAYRERGLATVSVALPQQQLTNATIQVTVTEGLLADVRVTGNQHFSTNNVLRNLPSARTNTLLNSRVFQRELDSANQNRDRQIYPTLGPGPEPGTSALTLRVQDRLPLHGRLEINNHSTPGTPDWRISASAQYNNLWQREHQLGVSYGFSPEAWKPEDLRDDYLLNRPLISNLGGYYRLPLGSANDITDRLFGSQPFGYDEATRQFRLPPANGQADLTFFGSAASSDTGVQYGPAKVVSQTPLLTIVSQDTGRNYSVNLDAGARFNIPVALADTRRLSFSAGLDWKGYSLDSFNTNNFLVTTVVTNAQGSQTLESRLASPQPPRHHEIDYLPLTIGADYSSTDARGSFAANLTATANFVGASEDFAPLGYSADTEATYGRFSAFLSREQKLPRDFSLLLRAAGQLATGPLISNEQFAVGGINSVRGYFEGDQYGDQGWTGSFEARTPFLQRRVATWNDFSPVWLRASAFIDAGQRFLIDASGAGPGTQTLLGTGFGLSANVANRADLRLVVGWPLLDTPNSHAGEPRAYVSFGGQF